MKTLELVDALKARHGLRSDYAVAKFLGVTHQTLTNWRRHRRTMSDETAIRVAQALELDPGEVLAHIQVERSDCPEVQAAWRRLAAIAHRSAAALVLVFVGVAGQVGEAVAAPSPAVALLKHCILW